MKLLQFIQRIFPIIKGKVGVEINEGCLGIGVDELSGRVISSGIGNKFCFITFLAKHNQSTILIPENFDPEQHLKNYPPINFGFSEKEFRNEKMFYLLSLLSEIPARNKDYVDENGFVRIKANRIRDNIKDYKKYTDYLIDTGVVIKDKRYLPNKFSMSFRLSDNYFQSRLVPLRIRELPKVYEEPSINYPQYLYLTYWFETLKLTIKIDHACQFLQEETHFKLQNIGCWDVDKDTKKRIHPISQYAAALNNIYACNSHEYRFRIDSTVYRLHSVLTGLKKSLRPFVQYDNNPLVSIDISNCQPYLTCVILNPEFFIENSKLPLNLFSLQDSTQSSIFIPSLSSMIGKFFKRDRTVEFDQYKNLVSTGLMYETLVDEIRNKLNIQVSRDEAKTAMFKLLFSSNRAHGNKIFEVLKAFFKVTYPSVFELFSIIKRNYDTGEEKPYARLSHLLMNIESEVVLHRCVKRIWDEYNGQIPIFTIHDSIVTTKGNEGYVHSIMMDELYKNIGVEPKLSVEPWAH